MLRLAYASRSTDLPQLYINNGVRTACLPLSSCSPYQPPKITHQTLNTNSPTDLPYLFLFLFHPHHQPPPPPTIRREHNCAHRHATQPPRIATMGDKPAQPAKPAQPIQAAQPEQPARRKCAHISPWACMWCKFQNPGWSKDCLMCPGKWSYAQTGW